MEVAKSGVEVAEFGISEVLNCASARSHAPLLCIYTLTHTSHTSSPFLSLSISHSLNKLTQPIHTLLFLYRRISFDDRSARIEGLALLSELHSCSSELGPPIFCVRLCFSFFYGIFAFFFVVVFVFMRLLLFA